VIALRYSHETSNLSYAVASSTYYGYARRNPFELPDADCRTRNGTNVAKKSWLTHDGGCQGPALLNPAQGW
jgi:hypothetical protein